ncbi:hypothetical protein [Streptomyces sp. NPDC015350]|uniref:hypothetical protein n=1 Tax=Streptomyces sp. NPDC015350 TaxID=3364955 RepID=UPI0036FA9FCD
MLRSDFRALIPVLPTGSHRRPMRPDADLFAHGIAALPAEFMDRMDLREVTLVQNDTGRLNSSSAYGATASPGSSSPPVLRKRARIPPVDA